HLGRCLFAPLSQCLGVGQLQISDCLLGDFQTVPRKWFAFDFLRHIGGIVVFAVPGKSQDGSDNKRWPPSCAGTFDCAADYLEACAEICSIEMIAFKTITDRAID